MRGRRFAGVLIVLVSLLAIGCGGVLVATVALRSTATSGSPSAAVGQASPAAPSTRTASPVPTPTAIPTPAPTAGYTEGPAGIVYQLSDGTVLAVPEIAGLEATLADGKVTYQASAGNPYGLKAGAYAGRFNPYVSDQQQDGSVVQTGGVGLVPAVVSKLMRDKMAAIPVQADKWTTPIPLAGATESSDVKITYVLGSHDVTMAKVDFQGELTVTNPLLLSKQVGIAANAYYGMGLFDFWVLQGDNAATVKPGQEAHYVHVAGAFQGVTINALLAKVFGDEVCTVGSTINLRFADNAQFFPLDKSKTLHVAPPAGNPSAPEVPVFLEEASAPV